MSNPTVNRDINILVVDDEFLMLEMVEIFLEQSGYKILQALNAREALQVAGEVKGNVDLLLTDVMMPVINGFQLAETIVRYNPDVKVIFISGMVQSSIKFPNYPSFRYDFIQKPFSYEILEDRIENALNRAQ